MKIKTDWFISRLMKTKHVIIYSQLFSYDNVCFFCYSKFFIIIGSTEQNDPDYSLLCIKIRFVQRNHARRDSRIHGKKVE